MEQFQNLQKNKRPVIITIVCVFGFIGVLLNFLGIIITKSRDLLIQEYGVFFIFITALVSLLGLIGFVGYWLMRTWGVYVYMGMTVLSIGYGFFAGMPFSLGYVAPIVIIIIGFFYFKEMS